MVNAPATRTINFTANNRDWTVELCSETHVIYHIAYAGYEGMYGYDAERLERRFPEAFEALVALAPEAFDDCEDDDCTPDFF